MSYDRWQFMPFFGQVPPERPILGLIADHDESEPYELDAMAVFAVDPTGYLIIEVSGCSCWPDRGDTYQTYCEDKPAVDRALTGKWRPLLDKCQDAGWAVTRTVDQENRP